MRSLTCSERKMLVLQSGLPLAGLLIFNAPPASKSLELSKSHFVSLTIRNSASNLTGVES
jgi:hypothetical protein